MLTQGLKEADVELRWQGIQESDPENILYHVHGNGDSLAETKKRARNKQNQRKEETLANPKENKQEEGLETPAKKQLTKKGELEKSFGDYTEELKKREEMFDDWMSSKAKDLAKLEAEVTNAEEQKSAFCRQRERIRKQIARLELDSTELAKRIIENDNTKNKLVIKRKNFEDRTDEKLYEHKIEKAKLQDAIQKTKFVDKAQKFTEICWLCCS